MRADILYGAMNLGDNLREMNFNRMSLAVNQNLLSNMGVLVSSYDLHASSSEEQCVGEPQCCYTICGGSRGCGSERMVRKCPFHLKGTRVGVNYQGML